MENKLYDFINFIAWPSYKLSKDEAQKRISKIVKEHVQSRRHKQGES